MTRNIKHAAGHETVERRRSGRTLKIGEVARESGVGIEALRFYERRGLLGRPARTESGYRLYDESVIQQLLFIKRAQAIGFSLDEIAAILAESASGQLPCQAVRQMARRKLAELDERLKELKRHRAELAEMLDEWDERGEAGGHVCGLIEESTMAAHHTGASALERSKKGNRR